MPDASLLSEVGILSPDQFSDQFYTSRLLPEKRLMLAVLLDAVECFQKHAPLRPAKPNPLFTDAATWIFEDDAESLFSFINICEAVGMNPQSLRRILSQGHVGIISQCIRRDGVAGVGPVEIMNQRIVPCSPDERQDSWPTVIGRTDMAYVVHR